MRISDWCHASWPALVVLCVCIGNAAAVEPCCVEIIDAENGWPVPLVELQTTHRLRFVSDNAGVIAMDAPELMHVDTWFHVRGHGYDVPRDGFGYAGVRLRPEPGKTLTVRVNRRLPAKRLGRLTGTGLFAESQKLGRYLQWRDQAVFGCDSVQNVVHEGVLYWGWGDTTLADYPLGRFHMIGATTSTAPMKSFEPPIELRYDYFLDSDERPKNLAPLSGKGPTWLDGYASVPGQSGEQHLVASYTKIEPPLTAYEVGLCVWREDSRQFERHRVLWKKGDDAQPDPPPRPHGHPVRWTDAQGVQWLLFGDPFPTLRCRATFDDWSDPNRWEAIAAPTVVTSRSGHQDLVPHRGAIAWNGYRNRWVTIFTQLGGKSSTLGELWYAESDSPLGPWGDAEHVVTHDEYSFYNPQIHAGFTPEGSPMLLFEATYTQTFSKSKDPTPRYDYNQILYRLDLDQLYQ
jgi:hypothetical protein